MDKISVLVVDDSALMRNLISRIINGLPNAFVSGKAMNGKMALDRVHSLKPDIVILDLEMPVMTGIEFMRERKKQKLDVPVVVLSSLARKGAEITMECLELGASDFLLKPSGSESHDIEVVADSLAEMIFSYGAAHALLKGKKIPLFDPTSIQRYSSAPIEILKTRVAPISPALAKPLTTKAAVVPIREPGPIEIIVWGISTGGPNALRKVFAQLSSKIQQPMLVVQHMPAGFTKEFANSLNNICSLEVKEASDGDLLKPGRILIAPGNKHIILERKSLATIVRLSDEPVRNGHRPSVDVLFASVAKEYKNRALGIIMTGMGRDGAEELAELRKQGSRTLGQDEKSSIVYGMPKAAWDLGGVQKQISLDDVAQVVNELVIEHA
ncbi:MAG TPA: chemotaxis response regulator protein-glutamate methylesterase [Treponemataceae bacterium]|nr:chemotaxis response regulator protein-glutamate methylesterase [Treponemataceae bacterium]